jgi:hypothetical protein
VLFSGTITYYLHNSPDLQFRFHFKHCHYLIAKFCVHYICDWIKYQFLDWVFLKINCIEIVSFETSTWTEITYFLHHKSKLFINACNFYLLHTPLITSTNNVNTRALQLLNWHMKGRTHKKSFKNGRKWHYTSFLFSTIYDHDPTLW